MKLIALCFGFLALFALSCKKIDSIPSSQQIPIFQCNINFHDWFPTHMIVDLRGPQWAEFYAYDSQYSVNVLIDDSTDLVATHELISDFNLAYLTDKQSGTEYSSYTYPSQNNGHLTITSVDSSTNTLSGNFAFTAYNNEGFSVVVKKGVLSNVPFIE